MGQGFDAGCVQRGNAPFAASCSSAAPRSPSTSTARAQAPQVGLAGRAYYRLCERLAASVPDTLITDAEVIRRYYRRCFRARSEMIVYGRDLERPAAPRPSTGSG